MDCEFHAELELGKDGLELVVTLVNVSPEEIPDWDTNVYEASLGSTPATPCRSRSTTSRTRSATTARSRPTASTAASSSSTTTTFRTTDVALYDQPRPTYWDDTIGPDRTSAFATLASDPLPALRELVDACERWGAEHWSAGRSTPRADADGWDDGMRAEADDEAAKFFEELARLAAGCASSRPNRDLLRQLHARQPRLRRVTARPSHGVAAVPARLRARQRRVDRRRQSATASAASSTRSGSRPAAARPRPTSSTSSRPRSTTVCAASARASRRGDASRSACSRSSRPSGSPTSSPPRSSCAATRRSVAEQFSLGFFVGKQGTPNRISTQARRRARDPADADMPARYQVLLRCPFCGIDELQMRFDQTRWALDHVCTRHGLPVGRTAAAVPHRRRRDLPLAADGRARDPRQGREHLDAGRDARLLRRPRGPVLRPAATASPTRPGAGRRAVASSPAAPRPRVRSARTAACTRRPSACRTSCTCCETASAPSTRTTRRSSTGSSPTTGRRRRSSPRPRRSPVTTNRSRALYRREGRTFPRPGPAGRPLVLVARHRRTRPPLRRPRPARRDARVRDRPADRVTAAGDAARRRGPGAVAAEIGVDRRVDAPSSFSTYGVDVVYGSTLKDVEAVARSFDTQIQLDRPVNAATLTGRTPLDEVRDDARPARRTPSPTSTIASTSSPLRRCSRTASTSTGSTSW